MVYFVLQPISWINTIISLQYKIVQNYLVKSIVRWRCYLLTSSSQWSLQWLHHFGHFENLLMWRRVYETVGRPSVHLFICLSVCLSVPSFAVPPFARCTSLWRVCCWVPNRQETSVDSGKSGAQWHSAQRHSTQQQMRAVSRLQPP